MAKDNAYLQGGVQESILFAYNKIDFSGGQTSTKICLWNRKGNVSKEKRE